MSHPTQREPFRKGSLLEATQFLFLTWPNLIQKKILFHFLDQPEYHISNHSIVIACDQDIKPEDLSFVMSRSTVCGIEINQYTSLKNASRFANLVQNVVSLRGSLRVPFSSVTRLDVDILQTNEKISSWLTPSIFPSLQILVVNGTSSAHDDQILSSVVVQVNLFPTPLESFATDQGYACLGSIRAKSLTFGKCKRLNFSKNSCIDSLMMQFTHSVESKFAILLPPKLKVLYVINEYFGFLGNWMKSNYLSDVAIRILSLANSFPSEDFDWIQNKRGIRELSLSVLGGRAIDEETTKMILDQLYRRHVNNIKPIEMIIGLKIVDSQIPPYLSTIYDIYQHSLQAKY
ncbi:hypothetical protein DFA_04449 [Cavenderia fasciculata]|uniref:Uncharacterized protein n=1 Tax=Cavenderia fasciculata TaxID=261658 RepID=F4PPL8_CACFS|nr:uncharacterized protein DFA_04449 [Cavenderia fasciculata]EGG22331.1 hypothetical protein DFA_04449 [Cavenderia fasciculata]|eukprot:XP_004360182.1 hypothetical protein DFA_04449 [Cavenderia fasciculata]